MQKVKIPHPVKVVVTELPGPALTAKTYDGFGKELCLPLEESSEIFGEDDSEETE